MQRPPDSELLRIQLRALFEFDTLGRMLSRVDASGGGTAPRVFAGSAGGSRLIRTRDDVPETVCRQWLRCDSDGALRAAVQAHGEIVREYRGPAFVLPPQSASAAAEVVRGTANLHPELVARGWKAEETPPYVGVVCDGLVVAVCYSSRSTDEAAEAGIETVEAYRGRGLAVEAARSWAAAVQASGRLALYSTAWDNLASRAVAAKLGAHEYGEDWHLT